MFPDALRRLGLAAWRPHQVEALEHLADGRSVVLHAPTGSGKSAVFMGAAVEFGLVVVAYPLQALIRDQLRRCEEIGLRHAALYGETRVKDRPEILDRLRDGDVELLLTTPETLGRNVPLQEALAAAGTRLLVVDEGHAYDDWAASFRPAYRTIGPVRSRIGSPPLLLCSATLTPEAIVDAADYLGESLWEFVVPRERRENLAYHDLRSGGVWVDPITVLVDAHAGRPGAPPAPGICYCVTVATVDRMRAAVARRAGLDVEDVLAIHGRMKAAEKKRAQEAWQAGERWIIATKAFGMGVDKANVRSIIHAQIPMSALDYAQECGRAGRDGLTSHCWLAQDDGGAARHLLDGQYPTVATVQAAWSALRVASTPPADGESAGARRKLEALSIREESGWVWCPTSKLARYLDVPESSAAAALVWLRSEGLVEKRAPRREWCVKMAPGGPPPGLSSKALVLYEAVVRLGRLTEDGYRFESRVLDDDEELCRAYAEWARPLRTTLAKSGAVLQASAPPRTPNRYRLLTETFTFEAGAKRLEAARARSDRRFRDMLRVRDLPPDARADALDKLMTLDVEAIRLTLSEVAAPGGPLHLEGLDDQEPGPPVEPEPAVRRDPCGARCYGPAH